MCDQSLYKGKSSSFSEAPARARAAWRLRQRAFPIDVSLSSTSALRVSFCLVVASVPTSASIASLIVLAGWQDMTKEEAKKRLASLCWLQLLPDERDMVSSTAPFKFCCLVSCQRCCQPA